MVDGPAFSWQSQIEQRHAGARRAAVRGCGTSTGWRRSVGRRRVRLFGNQGRMRSARGVFQDRCRAADSASGANVRTCIRGNVHRAVSRRCRNRGTAGRRADAEIGSRVATRAESSLRPAGGFRHKRSTLVRTLWCAASRATSGHRPLRLVDPQSGTGVIGAAFWIAREREQSPLTVAGARRTLRSRPVDVRCGATTGCTSGASSAASTLLIGRFAIAAFPSWFGHGCLRASGPGVPGGIPGRPIHSSWRIGAGLSRRV